MMRAGKDYIVKDESEYQEDERSQNLLELLETLKAQAVPAPTTPAKDAEADQVEETHAPPSVNHNKPTMKLR